MQDVKELWSKMDGMSKVMRTLHIKKEDILCHTCQSLELGSLPEKDELLVFDDEDYRSVGTLKDLLDRQNCPGCRLIIHLLDDRVRICKRQETATNELDSSTNIPCKVRRWRNVLEVCDDLGIRGYICSATRIALPFYALQDLQYRGLRSGGQLKIPQVREWIKTCEDSHHRCRVSNRTLKEHDYIDLTLIDVRNNCLVEASSSKRYLALSYVWGASKMLRTLKSTKDALHVPGALLERQEQIPQVIKDAMTLVSLLNERYLWVDSLSIVQDSDSKHEQIQKMDTVYRHAFLTIIAMTGRDATCPLPGVAFGSRPPLFATAETAGSSLISRPPNLDFLSKISPYESRAWTFQERLTSRRCLILTIHQAYFYCWSELKSEISILSEMDSYQWYKTFNPLMPVLADTFFSPTYPAPKGELRDYTTHFVMYARLVEAYCTRKLSFPQDKLNAFAGIESLLKRRFQCDFLCGVPKLYAGLALHWVASPPDGNIGDIENGKVQKRNKDFSSWSWAGHHGPVTYWKEKGLLNISDSYSSAPFRLEAHSFKFLHGNSSVSRHKPLPCEPSDGRRNYSTSLEVGYESDIQTSTTRGRLFFKTAVASLEHFSIREIEWESSTFVVDDKDGACCGRFWPDSAELIDDAFNSRRQNYKFALLSVSDPIAGKDLMRLGNHLNATKFPRAMSCVGAVLLLRSTSVMTERVGIGQIHMEAFKASLPQEEDLEVQ